MVPRERRADACKSSRFHISIEAQTVQSTLARIRASAPPAHHKAAEASKWSTQPHISAADADVLSPVVVRRANTSRTGSFPRLSGMWSCSTSLCSRCIYTLSSSLNCFAGRHVWHKCSLAFVDSFCTHPCPLLTEECKNPSRLSTPACMTQQRSY